MQLTRISNWLPLLVVVAVVLLATHQLTLPYVEHDDLDFLLDPSWGHGYATPWSKTLSEERWINYWWSLLGQHFSVHVAYAFFIGIYCCFSMFAARLIADGPLAIYLPLLIFLSPVFAHLSLWPAALTAGLLLLTVATFLLGYFNRYAARLAVLVLASWLITLSYPPFCGVLLVLAAAVCSGKTHAFGKTSGLIIGYAAGYALGVLSMFTLNDIYHEIFGLRIEDWRDAHPAHSLSDLLVNATQPARAVMDTLPHHLYLLVPSLGLLIIALATPGVRRHVALLTYVFLAVALVSFAACVVNGITAPFRALPWIWTSICALAALTLKQGGPPFFRLAAMALSAILLIAGINAWFSHYRYVHPEVRYEHTLAVNMHKLTAFSEQPTPLCYIGDPRALPHMSALQDPLQLQMSLLKRYNIALTPCAQVAQGAVRTYAAAHQVKRGQPFIFQDKLAVVF